MLAEIKINKDNESNQKNNVNAGFSILSTFGKISNRFLANYNVD
jgi:hypothetical protein